MSKPKNNSDNERPASYWRKGSRWILMLSVVWIILAVRAFSIGHPVNASLWLLVWMTTLAAAVNWHMKARKLSNENPDSSKNGDES
jgi:hypothetical protein